MLLVYATEAEFLKQRDHLDALAKADGWKPETVDDLTIGSRCTHVRDALANGTFESSGLADKILDRHVVYPLVADDGVRVAARVTPTVERYDGAVDSKTGDVVDLAKAVPSLPEDWAPLDAAAVLEKVIR